MSYCPVLLGVPMCQRDKPGQHSQHGLAQALYSHIPLVCKGECICGSLLHLYAPAPLCPSICCSAISKNFAESSVCTHGAAVCGSQAHLHAPLHAVPGPAPQQRPPAGLAAAQQHSGGQQPLLPSPAAAHVSPPAAWQHPQPDPQQPPGRCLQSLTTRGAALAAHRPPGCQQLRC